MSLAARAYPVTRPAVAPSFLSATINDDSVPQFRHVKIPEPLQFRSTSDPVLEWVDYPDGKYLRLTAGHTTNGVTRSFQIVFFVKPSTGTLQITSDSDLVALTYYSDPLNGALHIGTSGTLDLQYDEIEETLGGNFNGLFDHGGESGNERFPINGQFFAYGCKLIRK